MCCYCRIRDDDQLSYFRSSDHGYGSLHCPFIDFLSYGQRIFFRPEDMDPGYSGDDVLVYKKLSICQDIISPSSTNLDRSQFYKNMVFLPFFPFTVAVVKETSCYQDDQARDDPGTSFSSHTGCRSGWGRTPSNQYSRNRS